LVPLRKSASGGLCTNDIQTGNPEVEARFATQRLVLPNAVVLTELLVNLATKEGPFFAVRLVCLPDQW